MLQEILIKYSARTWDSYLTAQNISSLPCTTIIQMSNAQWSLGFLSYCPEGCKKVVQHSIAHRKRWVFSIDVCIAEDIKEICAKIKVETEPFRICYMTSTFTVSLYTWYLRVRDWATSDTFTCIMLPTMFMSLREWCQWHLH